MAADNIPHAKNAISWPARFLLVKTSRNFFAPAPAIIGPESIKAYFAAWSRLRPKNKPIDIVAPEREIPGMRAIDWATPIISEWIGDI